MLKHREFRLEGYLDRLALEGSVAIPWPELYQIYNCERLNKNAYRDIARRWEDQCTLTLGLSAAPKLTVMTTDSAFTITRAVFNDKEKLYPIETLT
jgi:hypothetical protein